MGRGKGIRSPLCGLTIWLESELGPPADLPVWFGTKVFRQLETTPRRHIGSHLAYGTLENSHSITRTSSTQKDLCLDLVPEARITPR